MSIATRIRTFLHFYIMTSSISRIIRRCFRTSKSFSIFLINSYIFCYIICFNISITIIIAWSTIFFIFRFTIYCLFLFTCSTNLFIFITIIFNSIIFFFYMLFCRWIYTSILTI
nr:MAG TPA: hypothetical protein [Caudoviricetes sp.]